MRKILSRLYSWFIARRNRRFDVGSGIDRIDVPVVSVGNITVGGTGKTPFVQMLLRKLLEQGRKPAVVSRGYGRRSRGTITVSDGTKLLCDVNTSGDELNMLARSVPGAVVIASEIRLHGAVRAVREYGVDCIVLDDGFQHRRLYRDLDIVLVDESTMQQTHILPAGLLREPLESLHRADVVCYASGVSTVDVKRWTNARCFELSTRLVRCTSLDSDIQKLLPRLAVIVTAIAQPARFEQLLKIHDVECVAARYFRDHHFYTSADVDSVIETCRENHVHSIVTTEKDAAKLVEFEAQFVKMEIDVVVVHIVSVIENDGEFWKLVDEKLTDKKPL